MSEKNQQEVIDELSVNIINYIQEIDSLKNDIEVLKKEISNLEKEKEEYRIDANKSADDIIALKNDIKYIWKQVSKENKAIVFYIIRKWKIND